MSQSNPVTPEVARLKLDDGHTLVAKLTENTLIRYLIQPDTPVGHSTPPAPTAITRDDAAVLIAMMAARRA